MEAILITEADVCEVLSLGRSTVRKLMAEGRLPYCHVGRALRFHRADVERLAESLRESHDPQRLLPAE